SPGRRGRDPARSRSSRHELRCNSSNSRSHATPGGRRCFRKDTVCARIDRSKEDPPICANQLRHIRSTPPAPFQPFRLLPPSTRTYLFAPRNFPDRCPCKPRHADNSLPPEKVKDLSSRTAVSELWWGEALGSGFCCV